MRKHITEFISPHLDIPAPETIRVPEHTICAFTGHPITEGVPLKKVIKPATATLADTFKYPSDVVSRSTAHCFADSRGLRGNLFITEHGIQRPMISAQSAAKQGRSTWQAVFQECLTTPPRTGERLQRSGNPCPTKPAIFVVTDESKRRLWTDAVITEGETLRVFLNNSEMARVIAVEKTELLNCIGIVQSCLANGFTKRMIASSLFQDRKTVAKIGWGLAREHERNCARYRNTLAFKLALFIGTTEKKHDPNTP